MDQKSTITETSHAEHPTAAQYFKVAMIPVSYTHLRAHET